MGGPDAPHFVGVSQALQVEVEPVEREVVRQVALVIDVLTPVPSVVVALLSRVLGR